MLPQFELWQPTLPPDCEVRLAPSFSESYPRLEKREVAQIQQNIQDGFTHIALAFVRTWEQLERQLLFECRVIKLSVAGDLWGLAWESLRDAILGALDYERRWCNVIKPGDRNHALLLPPPSFEPDRPLRNFWTQCNCYRDVDRITIANNLLQRVCSAHERHQKGIGAYWVDSRRLEFKIDRAAHGLAKDERAGRLRFRFCYELPHGFHYDVVHATRNRFDLNGRAEHHYNILRANVDSWGKVKVAAEVH